MGSMRDDSNKPLQKVSCLCGGTVRVDPSKQDRRVTCPDCRSTFDFVVTVDAARKKSMVSLVLPRAAMKTEGESLGATSRPDPAPPKAEPKPAPKAPPESKPVPRPAASKSPTRVPRKSGRTIAGVSMATCECGAVFPLEDNGELTSLQSCPQCNRVYHVVFKIEHGTKTKTPIIVPQKPIHHRMETMAPAKAAPRPGDVTDFFTKKGRTRVSKAAPKAKPKPEIPPGAQGVPCSCGEIFVVRRRDLGQDKTCEGCGKVATFEEGRDPQTLAPVIRIRK
jgi:hypothetical protein